MSFMKYGLTAEVMKSAFKGSGQPDPIPPPVAQPVSTTSGKTTTTAPKPPPVPKAPEVPEIPGLGEDREKLGA